MLDTATVTMMSPRLDPRLVDAAVGLDDERVPIAETWRRVRGVAGELGLPFPSYDTVRSLVSAHRRDRAEIRRLLEPVLADLVQGRLSAFDLDRTIEARIVARAARARRR